MWGRAAWQGGRQVALPLQAAGEAPTAGARRPRRAPAHGEALDRAQRRHARAQALPVRPQRLLAPLLHPRRQLDQAVGQHGRGRRRRWPALAAGSALAFVLAAARPGAVPLAAGRLLRVGGRRAGLPLAAGLLLLLALHGRRGEDGGGRRLRALLRRRQLRLLLLALLLGAGGGRRLLEA